MSSCRPESKKERKKDFDFDGLRAKLEKLRELSHTNNEDDPFYTRVVGGDAIHCAHGIAAHDIIIFARYDLPEIFCGRYDFPRQKGFTIRLYGSDAAKKLARAWATIGNHFWRL